MAIADPIPRSTPSQRRRTSARFSLRGLSVLRPVALGSLVILILWQAVIWLAAPARFILPAPLDVAQVFLTRTPHLLYHAGLTTLEACLGLILGAVFGALTAIGVAAFPRLGRLFWPLVLLMQALPVFAIAPLLVVWFGFGLASKLVMTTLIVFFPVASSFADGLRRTDRDILDACALTNATPWQNLRHIRIPLALPAFISGLKVAAPLAPLGAVVGEWVGASGGLGFIMIQANARLQTAEVFAALAILALLTLFLRALIDRVTAPLAPWAAETPFDDSFPKEKTL